MNADSKQIPDAPAILVDRKGPVLTLTFNRPSAMNAVTGEMCTTLRYLGDEVAADGAARVVVIQGAGKCFSVGGDARLFAGHLDNMRPLVRQMLPDFNEFVLALRRMDKVVIAKVHGVAAGGGLALALACDLVAAGAETQFAWGYRNIGTSPDAGGTYTLTRAVGEKKAFELLLYRHTFPAAEAERLGLINWVVPEAELDAFVDQLGAEMSKLSRNVVAQTKRLVNLSKTTTLEQQMAAEIESFALCTSRPDFREGITAFVGKRPPNFKD
jgi:2-(1,2-epoxy-1,2-dihydrophenyl)acetyl-CoA isomerase